MPVMFSVLERPAIPFAAEELRRYPWLRLVLSDVGNAIYVRRGERDEQAIAQALAVLRAGGVLAVDARGTAQRDGSARARARPARRTSRRSRTCPSSPSSPGARSDSAATSSGSGARPSRFASARRSASRPASPQPGSCATAPTGSC